MMICCISFPGEHACEHGDVGKIWLTGIFFMSVFITYLEITFYVKLGVIIQPIEIEVLNEIR